MTEGLQVQIVQAREEDREILRNLLNLYIYDLSQYSDVLEPNELGFYEYDGLDLYLERDTLTPFLIKYDEKVVGFIFVNQPPYAPQDVNYYVNELFVLKQYRGKGIAKAAVKQVFATLPGRYFVLQLVQNTPAIIFWQKLYAENQIISENNVYEYDGERCVAQRFDAS